MAQTSQVSRRYALALVESISAAKTLSLDGALGQLSSFNDAVEASFGRKTALLTPAFTRAERVKVVDGMIAHLKLSAPIARFVKLLVDNNRMAELAAITGAFRTLADDRRGRVRATVHSATALSR